MPTGQQCFLIVVHYLSLLSSSNYPPILTHNYAEPLGIMKNTGFIV